MIQRIQTVYLLLAIFVLSLPIWLPYAVFTGVEGEARLSLFGFEYQRSDGSVIMAGPPIFIVALTALSVILLTVSIFLFKNRKAQTATVFSSIFSQVLLLGYLAISVAGNLVNMQGMSFKLGASLGIFAPVLGIILAILAAVNIRKDEKLVRSADRIR